MSVSGCRRPVRSTVDDAPALRNSPAGWIRLSAIVSPAQLRTSTASARSVWKLLSVKRESKTPDRNTAAEIGACTVFRSNTISSTPFHRAGSAPLQLPQTFVAIITGAARSPSARNDASKPQWSITLSRMTTLRGTKPSGHEALFCSTMAAVLVCSIRLPAISPSTAWMSMA